MKLFLLTILLSFALSVPAQNRRVKVFLKNGSVFNGKIIETGSQQHIKIETKNNTWVFPSGDVDTVLYKRAKNRTEEIEIPWYFKVDGGALSGNNGNEENSIRIFHGTFNYEVMPKLYAGAGTGAEYYLGQTYIPVFVNLEYRLRQTRFTPHFFLKSGYVFPGENQHPSDLYDEQEPRNLPPKYLNANGGIMVNPAFGFTWMTGRNFGLSLAAGYRYHVLHYSGKDRYELEQHYNRLSFSFSIIFK